ncbi:MAG TPA: multicopper oxidase domain-containing protein [Candidatus Thermoplasmatota archaeon]|nr:multicopper oxidase domain-containing protein [Candidatus Thermoplasmatota archaeon]
MLPRRLALVGLLASSIVLAGCLGAGEGLAPASTDAASRAAAMLLDPPGSKVKETGITKEFDLYLHPMPEHEVYPGAKMAMWGFSFSPDPKSAQFPGPEIRVTEGDKVVVRFRPLVGGFEHSIHWHGQHVPWDMDGVPYVSQEPVFSGQEFVYTFIAKPAGTYWYHCHYDVQHHLDMGMYGPLVVEPQDPKSDPPFDAEVTLMLDEMDRFHLEGGNPSTTNMPQSGDPFDFADYGKRQAQDVANRNQQVQDAKGRAPDSPLTPKRSWYPDTEAPYRAHYNTFLINGASFPSTAPVMMPDGKVLRIRLINAGDQVHAMHLHGHHFLVTHKDGILLASPYWADSVLIGPGERYDLYVKGDNPGVWDLHDHMGTSLQNDYIWPGGMMTMFVYESFAAQAGAGGGHGHATMRTGHPVLDGQVRGTVAHHFVRWYTALPP